MTSKDYEVSVFPETSPGVLGGKVDRWTTGDLAGAQADARKLTEDGYGVRVRGASGCGVDEWYKPGGVLIPTPMPNYWGS